MKFKALLAVAALVLVSLACFVPADSDDATINNAYIDGGSNVYVDRGSTFTVTVKYTASQPETRTVTVYDSGNNEVWKERIQFKAGDYSFDIKINSSDIKSQAPVNMKISFENGAYKDLYFTLNYNSSIWDNGAIYAAIIVVAILVIALVLFKSRMAPKADKNTLTFEQIEAQRRVEKEAAPAKKSAPVKSERQRYLESKKK